MNTDPDPQKISIRTNLVLNATLKRVLRVRIGTHLTIPDTIKNILKLILTLRTSLIHNYIQFKSI